MRIFYVYILASDTRVLYTGVTNDLARRLAEHRALKPGSFSTRHRTTKLVYFEMGSGARQAIQREKQIKHWTRLQRIALIERNNPDWEDLSKDWGIP